MTDRELLELAAKAAGYKVEYDRIDSRWRIESRPGAHPDMWARWNPLVDDGDALRLAVLLNLLDGIDRQASAIAAEVNFDMDPCEATRRAIVRAAAGIASRK